MKILVVVDMQNDFIDGSLGTPEARQIVDRVAAKIAAYDQACVFATRDTHTPDYLTSCEGRHLPVVHCVADTPGHTLHPAIAAALDKMPSDHLIDKPMTVLCREILFEKETMLKPLCIHEKNGPMKNVVLFLSIQCQIENSLK